MPIDANRYREVLLDAKAEFEKRVNTIHNHARDPLNADSAEQAAELGNVEVVSALESEAVLELAEIDSALQRLQAGNFGICTTCGEDISSKRLTARPASAECLDCAELNS
ncbi:MAG: TraR/DksA family transcriptional regulator [Gammaproteobacteria bacterium]|nr:MAG: TraR/DksA family transcriptional regulator [Gammaproteobacteria bacterium]